MARTKVNGYGARIAKQRAIEKREAAQAKAAKQATSKRAATKRVPVVDFDVMSNPNIKPYDYIDWEDISTKNIGIELSNRTRKNYMSLLVMPTGSGKTAVTVYALGELQRKLGRKLPFMVSSIAKSVAGLGWQNTIAAYNRAFPDNILEPITITSHDKFASILTNAKSMSSLLRELTFKGIVVIDEVHGFKNPVSKRSKQLQKLGELHKIGVTATPLTNNRILDMSSYLIMGQYYSNKTQFERETGLMDLKGMYGQYLIYDYNGQVNEYRWPYYKTLLDQYAEIMYRPNVDVSTLDMPDVKSHIIQLEYSKELYDDLASLRAAQRKRMFESAIDFLLATVARICEDELRLDAMVGICKKHVQPLIFYQHNSAKDAILARLEKEGYKNIQVVSGGTDFAEIDLTTEDPILLQYQAGGASIELKKSNCSIFYENQYSHISLIQARGRNVRRASQNDLVHHYYLIADCAFDQELYNRVAQGEELTSQILEQMLEDYI